jgi:riboflavin kinase/FMN adenylyltransferase
MTKPALAKIQGIITAFQGNGRKFGYPTANLRVATDLTDGVYFGYADLTSYQRQPAIIFIGTPTTVGDTERRVEAFLLDIPDKDYYDLALTLYIYEFHRPNQTFESIDDLLIAMKADEQAARKWFSKAKVI